LSVDGGATITPPAPASITSFTSAPIEAKPGDDAPTTTGRPFTRRTTCRVNATDSAWVSFGASPMMPSTVTPVMPQPT
jgi:hypothetical protein